VRVVGSLIALLLAVTICIAASVPKPTTTEYLISTGAGFVLSKEEGAIYAMNYEVRKPFPSSIYCVALFEDPSAPDVPLRKELTVAADAKDLEFRSPGIRTIRNDHRYTVKLMLYLDAEHTKLLAEHDQEVLFSTPRGMFAQLRDQFGLIVQ